MWFISLGNTATGFADFGDFSGISTAASTNTAASSIPFADFSSFPVAQAPPISVQQQQQQQDLMFADFSSIPQVPIQPTTNEVI